MSYPYKQRTKRQGRRVDEHRWLMEQYIGRKLGRFEFVHHRNGDKRDNRLGNLEIVTPKEHAERHEQQKHPLTKACAVCGKVFVPHPTKRARARTCSRQCGYELAARSCRNPDGPRSKYRVGAYPSEIASRKSRRNS
jgi:HNH endonuclease